jgi:hypothetical protein
MPVRFSECSSADTRDPVDTQPSNWRGVPDSAYNRRKGLITGAGICDDEKYRGGPVRLPLLEKRTQVLGLRLAGRVSHAMATSSALSPLPNKIRSVSNAVGAPTGLA